MLRLGEVSRNLRFLVIVNSQSAPLARSLPRSDAGHPDPRFEISGNLFPPPRVNVLRPAHPSRPPPEPRRSPPMSPTRFLLSLLLICFVRSWCRLLIL